MRAAASARPILFFIVTVAAAFFVAGAMGVHALAGAPESHGKLTVKLSEKFTLHFPEGVTGVEWSPDGATLGVSSDYGVRLSTYDSSGRLLSTFKSTGNYLGAYINSFSFINGASQVLFPLEDGKNYKAALDIRDVGTGRILQTITRDHTIIHPYYSAVSPDQKRFAIANGSGKNVVTYGSQNGADWHELSVVNVPITNAGQGKQYWYGVVSLCFFPDSKLLAIGQNEGHFAIVDSTTGQTLKDFHAYDAPVEGISLNVDALAVSPKGDLLLTGVNGVGTSGPAISSELTSPWLKAHDGMVTVWRARDGKEVASLANPEGIIRQSVWDPRGRFVAYTNTYGFVVWQPDPPETSFIRVTLSELSVSLAITRDGKALAVAGGHKVTVYNIQDIQE